MENIFTVCTEIVPKQPNQRNSINFLLIYRKIFWIYGLKFNNNNFILNRNQQEKQSEIDGAGENNKTKIIADHPVEISIQTLENMPLDDLSNVVAASFSTSFVNVFEKK